MSTETPMNPATAVPAHRALKPTEGTTRLGGFDNLLRKELGDWFHTRRWWGQALTWLAIIDGFLTFALFVVPALARAQGDPAAPTTAEMAETGVTIFFAVLVTGGCIGTAILAQDEIIGERQTGTAAWILSKPLSRAAFVLGKWVADTIGVLAFIVAIPGAVGYVELGLASGRPLPVGPYLIALGMGLLTMLFYLSLALMMGTLSSGRGPVIGVCLGLILGGSLLMNFVPSLAYILPLGMAQFAAALVAGQTLPPVARIETALTAIWCVVFMVVAIWRFRHVEF